jgi:energy-converting hydrogenase Eha subunit G
MNETRSNLGLGVLALFSIVCCIGLPLIAATGISLALTLWVGGSVLGALVLIAATVVLVRRVRRDQNNALPISILRSRS